MDYNVMDYNNLAHCCHFCQKRYGACTKSSDVKRETYETHNCEDFVIGKCYQCAIHQAGSPDEQATVCINTFYPCGCPNYKEGVTSNTVSDIETPNSVRFIKEQEREKHNKRRVFTKKSIRKLIKKAKTNKDMIGPHFNKNKNRVVISERGKKSKYLKNQSNRTIRREKITENTASGKNSGYKKTFDYWWNLY